MRVLILLLFRGLVLGNFLLFPLFSQESGSPSYDELDQRVQALLERLEIVDPSSQSKEAATEGAGERVIAPVVEIEEEKPDLEEEEFSLPAPPQIEESEGLPEVNLDLPASPPVRVQSVDEMDRRADELLERLNRLDAASHSKEPATEGGGERELAPVVEIEETKPDLEEEEFSLPPPPQIEESEGLPIQSREDTNPPSKGSPFSLSLGSPSYDELNARADQLLQRLELVEVKNFDELGLPMLPARSEKGFAPEMPQGFRVKETPGSVSRSDMNDEGKSKPTDPKDSVSGWDLLVLRELALENSPEIRLKKAEVLVFEKALPGIRFQYFPTLKAKAGIDNYAKIARFQTYSEPEPYSVFSYGIEGRWVLYDGHKTRKQIKSAKLETAQAQWQLYLEEKKVLKILIEHFFSALDAQTSLTYLPQIEEIQMLRIDISSKQVEAGLKDRLVLNRLLRDVENVRSQSMESQMKLELSKSEMTFILNIEQGFWNEHALFLVPEEVPGNGEFDSLSLVEGLATTGVDLAKSRYDEIKSESSPSLELTGSAGYSGRNKLGLESNGQEMAFALNFEVPITGRIHTNRKLLKAREEINKSVINKELLLKQHQNEKLSEQLKLQQAEKNYHFQKELYTLQHERLKDVKSVSARGLFDKIVILEEREELLRRELSLEQARLKTLQHQYLLDLQD